MRTLTLAMLAALTGGCVSFPDTSEEAITSSLRKDPVVVLCISTVANLEAQLGEPARDGRLGSSRVLTWILEWDPLVRYLGVLVDANGTVVDIYWNLPTEIPWTPVDRCK